MSQFVFEKWPLMFVDALSIPTFLACDPSMSTSGTFCLPSTLNSHSRQNCQLSTKSGGRTGFQKLIMNTKFKSKFITTSNSELHSSHCYPAVLACAAGMMGKGDELILHENCDWSYIVLKFSVRRRFPWAQDVVVLPYESIVKLCWCWLVDFVPL